MRYLGTAQSSAARAVSFPWLLVKELARPRCRCEVAVQLSCAATQIPLLRLREREGGLPRRSETVRCRHAAGGNKYTRPDVPGTMQPRRPSAVRGSSAVPMA